MASKLTEEKANQARDRLRLVRRNLPPPLSVTAVAAAALIAVGTIGYFVAHQRAQRRRARRSFRAVARWFRPPPPAPSFWSEVGTRTSRALLTFALIEAGKLAIRRGVESVTPPVSQAGF